MQNAVVIERAGNNYSAYVPDLSGRVATSATLDEGERNLRNAVRFHIEGLREERLPIPEPSAHAGYVDA